MVSGDRGGGAVRALTVGLGDVAVLADRTGTLIVASLKTFFKAFGHSQPILDVIMEQGWLRNHRDEDNSEPLMVQQHHDQ